MHRRTFLTAAAASGMAALLSACVPMTGGEASPDDLMNKMSAMPDLSTFVAALTAAGLSDRLHTGGPYTVFAPTNAAFARLGKGRVDALMAPANKGQLAAILSHHIARGSFTAAMLQGQKLEMATLGQKTLLVDGKGGLYVDRVRVGGTEVDASNGVIFTLDRVLMQP
ncbi:MAG: fasciclin domain-containing protein [Paracoccaceae bacterium]|nr:fasciclin domain-containing protein [Paracoccaceae bacterium]MDE3237872.1 fasciclin domain-containing protein [Paracoccaceae bacterium]